MRTWSLLLETPEPGAHLVHLYGDDEQLLTRNVAMYACAGLDSGEGVLIVATPVHSDAILRRLRADGCDVEVALGSGLLKVLDATATLDSFLVARAPDWDLVEEVIGGALAKVRHQSGDGKVRVFGEMVGLLWERGERSLAVLLEEYWNRLLAREDISLFCAYPVDILEGDHDRPDLNKVMAAHTHICAGPRTLFSNAV